jgi:hypothetical protein
MEYASELIVKAAISNVPIVEVPITLHKDKRDRPPHLRPWRDGWRHLRLLLWHAPDQTMLNPGLVLLLLGLGLVLSQIAGPFTIGGVLFDIHYMILGLTLSMLGLSSATLGMAVHAIMPERKIKKSRLFGDTSRWFTFDHAAIGAALFLLAGFASDGYVLYHWIWTHRGELTPQHTRISLVGLLFIAVGFQLLLSGLLVGTARSAVAVRALGPPPLPGATQEERA